MLIYSFKTIINIFIINIFIINNIYILIKYIYIYIIVLRAIKKYQKIKSVNTS